MLSRSRALFRTARRWPIISPVLRGIDEFWWARTIRRAGVVDLDLTAAQRGRRLTERQAIRHYVRGGFRDGFTLNPLFLESLVSRQLSDADRVPALYAYLVNDPRRLEVSPNWRAPEYALSRPSALADPAGPLGHAWRHVSHGGSLELGFGSMRRAVSGGEITRVAVVAAMESRQNRTVVRASAGRTSIVAAATLVSFVAREEDCAPPLLSALEFGMLPDRRSVVVMTQPQADSWVQASLMTLWHDRVTAERVCADPSESMEAAVGRRAPSGAVVVRGVRAEITSDSLNDLVLATAAGPVAPLWLAPDGTVASAGCMVHDGRRVPLLAGHPVEDARRLGDSIDVVDIDGDTFALPADHQRGDVRPRTLLTTIVTAPLRNARTGSAGGPDTDVGDIMSKVGMRVQRWTDTPEGPRPVLTRDVDDVVLSDGTAVPRLRWAIKTASPAGPEGEAWGDTHFARGIAAALTRLGQEVIVDAFPAHDRPSAYLDDVVLSLRGPRAIGARTASTSLLWIISHPDEITRDEITRYDRVFAASAPWAATASRRFGVRVDPLLQCTDPHRFRPHGLARGADVVFVGTARGIPRPSVVEPIRAGVPVAVYGPDWRGFIPAENIVATGIPNDALGSLYESARVVLNDHWPAMRREGFISNRIYDVVASGGRVISDEVEGIDRAFGGAVITYDTVSELVALFSDDLDARFAGETELASISARVRQNDSFDARAMTLLQAAIAALEPLSRTASDRLTGY